MPTQYCSKPYGFALGLIRAVFRLELLLLSESALLRNAFHHCAGLSIPSYERWGHPLSVDPQMFTIVSPLVKRFSSLDFCRGKKLNF